MEYRFRQTRGLRMVPSARWRVDHTTSRNMWDFMHSRMQYPQQRHDKIGYHACMRNGLRARVAVGDGPYSVGTIPGLDILILGKECSVDV